MANTKVSSTLGEITSNFILNDFDVYLMNTSATGGYATTDWALLGFTSVEKGVNRITEKYRREAKIPRVETFVKTIRKGLELTFDLSNFNEDLISIFTQGSKISLGATGTKISHGTVEAALEFRALRFTTTREDNKTYAITIPKTEITVGESTFGGETESVLPIVARAQFNPSANSTADIYTEEFLAASINATGTVPSGFN